MDKWIPLLQALIWPLFATVLLIVARTQVRGILKAIEERVAAGAPIEAGASGIKLGSVPAPQQPLVAKVVGQTRIARVAETATSEYAAVRSITAQHSGAGEPAPDVPKPGSIYLVHEARRDRASDRGELKYYRLRIYLDSDESAQLDGVEKVVYFLHDSFAEPVRVSTNRGAAYELVTTVWGQFNAAANIVFNDGRVVKVERYLNF